MSDISLYGLLAYVIFGGLTILSILVIVLFLILEKVTKNTAYPRYRIGFLFSFCVGLIGFIQSERVSLDTAKMLDDYALYVSFMSILISLLIGKFYRGLRKNDYLK